MDNLIDIAGWPDRTAQPFLVTWPTPGNVAGFLTFCTPAEWVAYIQTCDLRSAVPTAFANRFRQAQKLYALAWLEYGVIKAGELAALVALESALKARYGSAVKAWLKAKKKKKNPLVTLSPLLRYLVEVGGMTDADLPCVKRHGGVVIPNLYEPEHDEKDHINPVDTNPGKMDAIRNRLPHGDPFETMPWGGLLEVTRDLIDFAYR